MGACTSTTWNVFCIGAQALRTCFIPIRYYNHLTCHISRCYRACTSRPILDNIRSRIFKYGKVHNQVHAILQTTTRHWVATFTPFFRLSIRHGARGNITDIHVITTYGFTVVGKPQEESSLVHNFFLDSTVIFHHMGQYPCPPRGSPPHADC